MFERKSHITEIHSVLYVEGEKEYVNRRTVYHPVLPYYELTYKLSGESTAYLDDTRRELKPGVVTLRPPGKFKQYYVETDIVGDCIDIYFSADIPPFPERLLLDLSQSSRMRSLFLQAHKVWKNRKPGYYFECLSITYKILQELAAIRFEYVSGGQYSKIEPGVRYLCEHYNKSDFSCKELSVLCEMSYSYFKRLFMHRFGVTPVQYLTQLRMEHAAELLKTGKFSVSEIAEMTGYNSSYYFIRVFKEYFGCTPSKYLIHL